LRVLAFLPLLLISSLFFVIFSFLPLSSLKGRLPWYVIVEILSDYWGFVRDLSEKKLSLYVCVKWNRKIAWWERSPSSFWCYWVVRVFSFSSCFFFLGESVYDFFRLILKHYVWVFLCGSPFTSKDEFIYTNQNIPCTLGF
jgi:hypothetical protein